MAVAITLLSGATANGDGPLTPTPQLDPLRHQGMTIYVSGNFGSGTVTLNASADGITFLPVPNATLTAPGIVVLDINAAWIKATVSGVTGSANIWAIGL